MLHTGLLDLHKISDLFNNTGLCTIIVSLSFAMAEFSTIIDNDTDTDTDTENDLFSHQRRRQTTKN